METYRMVERYIHTQSATNRKKCCCFSHTCASFNSLLAVRSDCMLCILRCKSCCRADCLSLAEMNALTYSESKNALPTRQFISSYSLRVCNVTKQVRDRKSTRLNSSH